MKKEKRAPQKFDYISTRSIILIIVLLILALGGAAALLILCIQERKSILIPIIEFLLLFLAAYAGYFKIKKPLDESEKIFKLFSREYLAKGIFDMRYPLSPESYQAFLHLQDFLADEEFAGAAKRQAQYLALQNQINPHFLYNTLEGIRGEAMTAGMDNIAKMTEALSTFFRYTISGTASLVTLEDELENVDNYFIIQQYRFGSKLSLDIRYDCDDQEEVLKCRMPKLILQPVIENAIVHGLEEKVGNGKVTIQIEETGKRLIITVSDNGIGIEKEQLAILNKKLEHTSMEYVQSDPSSRGSGIALVNVNNRIRLLFGDEYGMVIYSTVGFGTDVQITIPRLLSGENHFN